MEALHPFSQHTLQEGAAAEGTVNTVRAESQRVMLVEESGQIPVDPNGHQQS